LEISKIIFRCPQAFASLAPPVSVMIVQPLHLILRKHNYQSATWRWYVCYIRQAYELNWKFYFQIQLLS